MKEQIAMPFIQDQPPLPRRVGLSWVTSKWNMDNRHGSGALNTVQPEPRRLGNTYGGFRIARDTMGEP